MTAGPIDAVVAWVDGGDPVHRAKRARFDAGAVKASVAGERFEEAGEILYCLRSLLRFAPFLRRIHVVTDAQVPPAIARVREENPAWAERIVVVDHHEVFRDHEAMLPTFNSRSIEAVLHRIPELSERFIYLNDDVLLARPHREADFFMGPPVLRGRWRWLRPSALEAVTSPFRSGPRRAGNARGQERAARLAGFRWRYAHAGHVPHAMRRSTIEAFHDANPAVLERQIAHRFRSAEQFLPTALARHLELRDGAPLHEPNDDGYLRPDHASRVGVVDETLRDLLEGRYATFCVQELSAFEPSARRRILAAFEALLPPPSH